MKPTARRLLGLVFAVLTVTVLAEDTPAASAPPADTPPVESPKTVATVTTPAPRVPFTPLASGRVDDKQADPAVLELPKMVVKQKPRPRLTPEIMVTRKAFGEQLAKEKFSGLDQALNKFTIPLFGAGIAERALEEHEREKKEQLAADVLTISKALEAADPTEAKSLKDAATRP